MNPSIRLFRRYRAFSAAERRSIWRAWPVLWGVRILLSVSSYRWLEAQILGRPLAARGSRSAADIAMGVERAARLVAAPTCLTRSLAAAWLLRGAGYVPRLHIGVANGADGFKAHAWLECDGDVLIGGEIKDEFHPFTRH